MDVAQALKELAPGGSRITRTFDAMGVAEEELAAAGISTAPGAFVMLLPPTGMLGLAHEVYRHHCRELIARAKDLHARGLDYEQHYSTIRRELRVPTKAEVLAGLSLASLAAPPGQQFAALMEQLFEEVMGVVPAGDKAREPWQGASAELLLECRRLLKPKVNRLNG